MKKQKLSPAEQPPAATPQEGLPTEGKTAVSSLVTSEGSSCKAHPGSHSVDQTLKLWLRCMTQ